MKTGKDHPWHKAPRWRKRLEGFVVYQLHSWMSLLSPEHADRIMFNVLRDQFEEDEQYLALEWVQDMPIVDGAVFFDSMDAVLLYTMSRPLNSWTIPIIKRWRPTDE